MKFVHVTYTCYELAGFLPCWKHLIRREYICIFQKTIGVSWGRDITVQNRDQLMTVDEIKLGSLFVLGIFHNLPLFFWKRVYILPIILKRLFSSQNCLQVIKSSKQ